MSVVVAVRKEDTIALAADSLESFGGFFVASENHRICKIRRVGPALIGFAGWGVYENILDNFLLRKRPPLTSRESIFSFFMDFWRDLHDRYAFVNDQAHETDTPFGDLDAWFLVASPEGIFSVSSDMSVSEFLQYNAIGSGAAYAMGALHVLYPEAGDAEQLASRAVEAALAFNRDCGGPIDVETLKISS